MRTGEDRTTSGARATRPIGRWRCGSRIVLTLGALVVLLATSCVNLQKITPGDELGCAMEQDDVLPEGVVWRSSRQSRAVCIFGVTDLASQDRVVEGARESLRRMGGTRGFKSLKVEFWSGDPPPREVQISDKPPAFPPGAPPPAEPYVLNAPYAISLVRTVEIP
jgi:hypothetical protein